MRIIPRILRKVFTGRIAWIAAAAIVVVGLGALFLPKYAEHHTSKYGEHHHTETLPDNFQEWGRYLQKNTPKMLSKKIQEEYATAPAFMQHRVAHHFGFFLYKELGKGGIEICDYAFGNFGCIHGFAMKAVMDSGFGALPELNEICVKQKTPRIVINCQHGLGHGILYILRREKLQEALQLCIDFSVPSPEGCFHGVFMQYFTPLDPETMLTTASNFNPERPYGPCPEMPQVFHPMCYFQLSLWWDTVLKKDYQKIGTLCGGINDKDVKEACFRGAGDVAVRSSDFNPLQTIQRCRQMPHRFGETICRATASQNFAIFPQFQKFAPLVCGRTYDPITQRCHTDL